MNEGITLIENQTASFRSKIELALMNEGKERLNSPLSKIELHLLNQKMRGERKRRTRLVIGLALMNEGREIELAW